MCKWFESDDLCTKLQTGLSRVRVGDRFCFFSGGSPEEQVQQVDGELQFVRTQSPAHGFVHPHRTPRPTNGAQLHPQRQEQSHGHVNRQHWPTEAQHLRAKVKGLRQQHPIVVSLVISLRLCIDIYGVHQIVLLIKILCRNICLNFSKQIADCCGLSLGICELIYIY